MENLKARIGVFALGLMAGMASGYCATFELNLTGAMFWPPIVFWIVNSAMILLFQTASAGRLLLLLIAYLFVYLICFYSMTVLPLFGIVFLAGSLMAGVSLHEILRLATHRSILLGGGALLFIGILADVYPSIFNSSARSIYGAFPIFGYLSPMPSSDTAAIFLWQTIMMTAITLQLHAERRYRQRLAAQEAAEGGAPEP